jgi:hypothetical protein
VAVNDDLPASPLGISTGLEVPIDFLVGLGTALSAPLVLLLAFAVAVVAASRGGRLPLGVMAVFGVGFGTGMLAEPITYRVLSPGGFEPVHAAIVVGNLVLAVAIVGLALLERRRAPGEGSVPAGRYTEDGP